MRESEAGEGMKEVGKLKAMHHHLILDLDLEGLARLAMDQLWADFALWRRWG